MNNENLAELLAQKYHINEEKLKIIIEAIPANIFFKRLSLYERDGF